MNEVLQDLIAILDLEQLELNLFRGQSRDLGGKSVFGGQVLGQALVAATRTVEQFQPHSIHAYFLRPGDMQAPIVYDVDRLRDGRSFSVRRVQAIQHGRPIFSMITSFQDPEPGLDHQVAMPEVPGPEKLKTQVELREEWLDDSPPLPEKICKALMRELAIEFKPVNPWNALQPDARDPAQPIWFRAAGKLPNDPMLHKTVLAYASDFNLLSTALLPHGKSWFARDMIVASLDHALWFHREFRVDEWLLYSMESPTSQGARGLSRALIFNQQGELVASAIQESLMRWTSIVPAED